MLERGATVKQVEDIAAKKKKSNDSKEEDQRKHILYRDIENTFQSFFGTKVRLDAGRRRGKIIIEYSGNDDLERILGLMR